MKLYTCDSGLNLMKSSLNFWAWTEDSDEYRANESNRNPVKVPEVARLHSPGEQSFRIIDPGLCKQIEEE